MTMGTPCTDNGDCDLGYVLGTCNNGQCDYPACAPENQVPCSSNSDCSSGADRCAAQNQAVSDCVEAASSVNLVFGSSYSQPPPEPGPQG